MLTQYSFLNFFNLSSLGTLLLVSYLVTVLLLFSSSSSKYYATASCVRPLNSLTNWREIKNHVKIRNEKGDDGKMYIYLDPQLEDLTVGARLAFVREFRGLTQDAVA